MRYQEPSCISRYSDNPVVTAEDVPYPCTRTYNPAVCKVDGRYAMIIRTEDPGGDPEQALALGWSDDGYTFRVQEAPIMVPEASELGRLNDPRVTFIEGWYYLAYCSDPGPQHKEEGIYLCIARSRDLQTWERFYRSEPDNRNAVIFPEKVDGLYARLDRPFRRGYQRENGYDVWISFSPDMEFWGRHHLVLSHRDVPWGSHKIGPAGPPVRTERGWLTLFHGAEIVDPAEAGVTAWAEGGVTKVYRAGVMLLDLEEPWKIIGIRRDPLLEITTDYEQDPDYRPNVIFPTGVVPEDDGTVRIYYGASDTTIAVAEARIDDLVSLCDETLERPYLV